MSSFLIGLLASLALAVAKSPPPPDPAQMAPTPVDDNSATR